MPWLKKFQLIINWKMKGIEGWADVEPIPRAPCKKGAVRKTMISTDLEVKASTGKEEVILPDQYKEYAKDSDVWKGAFITPLGLFEPLVMFFGQKNSPPMFQQYMDITFCEQLMKRQQIGYMDDIIVHAKTHEELCCHIHEFLSVCCQEQLRLKISKCVFEAEEVEFLGYVIGKGQIKMHAIKTDAIQEWKEPQNLTQLRSFLGFTNFYQKFIAGYSTVSAPLHHLSKKVVPWKWD
ncbi:hypothetical protein PISMIDRAFT_16787 [Pisolithus microcarpus 441]|uniref:Reverse transcriptase domain-containing protein n=1 Tax=Pisolithus microcarpus 441 TaxID=765257 RepID=A0A0C9YY37_9AGAM|nr:hypothetical protein PISMIDRAFT_16787 [Pisolithus microcarpus 441]